ncbi:endonuclease III domain-containing protein [Candidatus Woesearchaeota archaeon]|nr:endonuclease III domain-containing protein [Candidatus Woesearchaeota archaeon]
MNRKGVLEAIYTILYGRYGSQNWWPYTDVKNKGFEICLGAILTQNTSWQNVEKALENLKANNLLSINSIDSVNFERLSTFLRPSGYFNQKAKKLKAFVRFIIKNYDGDLKKLLSLPIDKLREELLSIYGVGPETADSIILYAANKPIFVIDAYTKRVMSRLGFGEHSYESLQSLFMDNLSLDTEEFNEFHALFVRLGKEVCRTKPKCSVCCLKGSCHYPSKVV